MFSIRSIELKLTTLRKIGGICDATIFSFSVRTDALMLAEGKFRLFFGTVEIFVPIERFREYELRFIDVPIRFPRYEGLRFTYFGMAKNGWAQSLRKTKRKSSRENRQNEQTQAYYYPSRSLPAKFVAYTAKICGLFCKK